MTYRLHVAYPELERLALLRSDRRLKPAALLRYWYLARLQGPRLTRDALFQSWALLGQSRSNLRRFLQEGKGVFWEEEAGLVRLYPPEELHARLELPVVRRLRPVSTLLLPTGEWHRVQLEDSLERFRLQEGKTDPISQKELGRRIGVCRQTVRRLLKRSRRIEGVHQWVEVGTDPARVAEDRARGPIRYRHLQHLPSRGLFALRLENAYRIVGPTGEPGEERSRVGNMLRSRCELVLSDTNRGDFWRPKDQSLSGSS